VSAQAMQALKVANDRRLRQAALKRQCRQGTVDVMSLIASGLFDRMFLMDVLQMQCRWGADRAARTMNRVALPATVTVGQLTERQTALLSRFLRSSSRWERDEISYDAHTALSNGRAA